MASPLNSVLPVDVVSSSLGIPTTTALIFLAVLMIWSLVWKGFALWKSSSKKKIIWFIVLLITNTAGIFEILYLFLFSKAEEKNYLKMHDHVLKYIVASLILTLVLGIIYGIIRTPIISNISGIFLAIALILLVMFGFSIAQGALERKDWLWFVLSIIILPIVPVIYYFSKIRKKFK